MREFPVTEIEGWAVTFVLTPEVPERPAYVLVILCREGEVLLVDSPSLGWSIPGGRVEEGESALEAVVRELREEAGAVPEGLMPLGYYVFRKGEEFFQVSVFVARAQEVQGGELARKWVRWDDLKEEYYTWNELFETVFQSAKEKCPI